MARYHLDEGAAFAFLARTSSHSNTKIRDVAAQMLEDHNSAPRPRTPPPGDS